MKFITFSIVLLAFVSCKKDKKSEVLEQSTIPDKYAQGYLSLAKQIWMSQGKILTTVNTSRIQFFGRLAPVDSADYYYPGLDLGAIRLNKTGLKTLWQGAYFDSTFTAHQSPFHVTNAGSDKTVPQIDFTVFQSFPDFSDFASLPDTIFISGNNSFEVKGYSGCNSIQVLLGYNGPMHLMQNLSAGDSNVSFSLPNSYFPFPDHTPMQFSIIFSQGHTQLLNNQLVYVETMLQINLMNLPVSSRHKR